MEMPVHRLPKCLETLMVTLLEAQNLQGWQIFQEKNSAAVTLKLRFTEPDSGLYSGPAPCAYKKKSSTQASRDRKRAQKHKSQHTDHGMITRSKCTEKPRTGDEDLYLLDRQPLSWPSDLQEQPGCGLDISVATCPSPKSGDPSMEKTPVSEYTGLDIGHASPHSPINISSPPHHTPQTLTMDQLPIVSPIQPLDLQPVLSDQSDKSSVVSGHNTTVDDAHFEEQKMDEDIDNKLCCVANEVQNKMQTMQNIQEMLNEITAGFTEYRSVMTCNEEKTLHNISHDKT